MNLPQIRIHRAADAILQDPRLDYLIGQIGMRWVGEISEDELAERKASNPLTRDSNLVLDNYLGYVADLHCKRALRALREGKAMPGKVTASQAKGNLRDEDTQDLNRMVREVIGQHIVLLAEAMNECAVLFSDPVQIGEILHI